MNRIILLISIFMIAVTLKADECENLKSSFEKEEAAYDTVARIAVAGNKAYAIIGKFIEEGDILLKSCPGTYSLDRQYTLKRKLATAKKNHQNYRVFTQSQLSDYARSHPEEIVVYKWGTIRPIP